MYNIERQKEILQILRERKRCSVRELSSLLFASEATVRRDLTVLSAEGRIQKVFGGALLCEDYAEEVPFAVRRDDRIEVKQSICHAAAELLAEGMTLFLDASTTPEQLVPHLRRFQHLQIVTNNPRLPLLLADTALQVYSTGGRLSHSSQAYVGGMAEDVLSRMNADVFFFSARGVTEDGQITDSATEESRLKQLMHRRAAISCFLLDANKIGKAYLSTIAACRDVDYVFCNQPLPEALRGRRQRSDAPDNPQRSSVDS